MNSDAAMERILKEKQEQDIQGDPNVDEDYLRQEQDADNAITCPNCGCSQAYYWLWKDAGWCPACKRIFDLYQEESMSSPCNDCSVDCFTDECPIKQMQGHSMPEEDWKIIADKGTVHNKLAALFPHGHEKFIELSLKEMELHSQKNYDYAHGGNPLGNFTRVASILSNYPRLKLTPAVIALIYAFKQLDSTLWQLSQGYEGQVEGMDKRLEDVHVYVKLARILLEEA